MPNVPLELWLPVIVLAVVAIFAAVLLWVNHRNAKLD